MTTESYEVRKRWNNEVQFTAQIKVTRDMTPAVKLGLAVRWGRQNNANLSGAYLRGANLSDADLRSFIADLWMILSMARPEVPALVAELRNGQVDGSTYSGDCACLVGTLENAGAVNIPHEASSPAEQWFAMIRKGDKPGDDSAGGFAAGKALEWVLDYCARTGIELPEVA